MSFSILAQRDRLPLDNGMQLRLLSALEMLQARREAAEMAKQPKELALCSNACLLARALERDEDHTRVFPDAQAVLAGLTVEEIAALARRWSEFHKQCNPGLEVSQEELEQVKKNCETAPRSGCAGECCGR